MDLLAASDASAQEVGATLSAPPGTTQESIDAVDEIISAADIDSAPSIPDIGIA